MSYTSPSADQIPAEMIQEVGEVHELIRSVWNREEWPQQCKKSIILQIYKTGDTTGCDKLSKHISVINLIQYFI
jgi:hypothetical protein